MEDVRKFHNSVKRNLITKYAQNAKVLDVGCGRGGDLHKWKSARAHVTMIDPDGDSVMEARRRQKTIGTKYSILKGDIFRSPKQKYDVVCYNFSFQYVFREASYFYNTLYEIKDRLDVGGKFMGCIPDSEFILTHHNYKDRHGNFFDAKKYGQLGDMVDVMLVDTPYYGGNVIPEPIAYKDFLVTWMENNDFEMIEWAPIAPEPTGIISDLYSKFCFVKIR